MTTSTQQNLCLRCAKCNRIVTVALMGDDPKRDADHYLAAAKAMQKQPGKYVQSLEAEWRPEDWRCNCAPSQGSLL